MSSHPELVQQLFNPLPAQQQLQRGQMQNRKHCHIYIYTASVLDISSSATDRPVQPMLTSFKRTQVGSTVRSFSSHWYKKFPTIEYSAVHDAVFCFVCHHFQPANAYAESVFRKTGFSNWKKFGSRMQ